jgi:hypothetical protein
MTAALTGTIATTVIFPEIKKCIKACSVITIIRHNVIVTQTMVTSYLPYNSVDNGNPSLQVFSRLSRQHE